MNQKTELKRITAEEQSELEDAAEESKEEK